MIFESKSSGKLGIVKDVASHELSPDAWTDGRNIRFVDGSVQKMDGDSYVYSSSATAIGTTAYYVMPVRTDSEFFWTYAGTDAIYATDGSTHSDISNGAYNMNSDRRWNGGFLQGLAFFNNGVDCPQVWVPGLTNNCVDLTYDSSASSTWSTVGIKADVLHSYKEFMIALAPTEAGTKNSRRLWFSHRADAGAMPQTWDYAKPAFDAGQIELDDEPEPLIWAANLRDNIILYKHSSAYRMFPLAAPHIFGTQRLFSSLGTISRHCVAEWFGQHFVFGFNDVFVHDGQNATPILKPAMRRWLSRNLNDDAYQRCQVVPDYLNDEIWALFPYAGATENNMALVWNYREQTVTLRELDSQQSLFMSTGIIQSGSGGPKWSEIQTTYNEEDGRFSDSGYKQAKAGLLFSDGNDRLRAANSSQILAYDGTMTAYVEREALPLTNEDGVYDTRKRKFIKNIFFRMEGSEDVTIKLGDQVRPDGPIAWTSYTFNPQTDYKLDCFLNSRMPALRIESTDTAQWTLHGFSVDYDLEGDR